MIWLGMLLIVVGFALVTPRGATPGGAAHRFVFMDPGRMFSTPGYREQIPRGAWQLRVAGVALLVVGFGLVFAVT